MVGPCSTPPPPPNGNTTQNLLLWDKTWSIKRSPTSNPLPDNINPLHAVITATWMSAHPGKAGGKIFKSYDVPRVQVQGRVHILVVHKHGHGAACHPCLLTWRVSAIFIPQFDHADACVERVAPSTGTLGSHFPSDPQQRTTLQGGGCLSFDSPPHIHPPWLLLSAVDLPLGPLWVSPATNLL